MRFLSTDRSCLAENSKQRLSCIRCESPSHPNPAKGHGNAQMYKMLVYSTEGISAGSEGKGNILLSDRQLL